MDRNAFLIALSEGERTEFGRIAFARQESSQKVFSAIWELESQVNNGGFDQYLRFSDADIIAHAPAALHSVGAVACEGIVRRALQTLDPLPSTQEARSDALDALADEDVARLEALDQEFFAYPDDLTALLFEYVRQRPSVFGPIDDDAA